METMQEAQIIKEKTLVCNICGSDNILFLAWVDENNKFKADGLTDRVWCNKCDNDTKPKSKE